MVDLTAEENISVMCQVMSNPALHQKAADSYKWTGTTNALDGTEDELIAGDARQFWDELGMRGIVNTAMAEVEQEWKAGNLNWTFRTVYSLVGAYPARGQLDEWRPGMDDEATPDPTLTRTMKTMYPRKTKMKRSLTTTSGIGLTHIAWSTAVAVPARTAVAV